MVAISLRTLYRRCAAILSLKQSSPSKNTESESRSRYMTKWCASCRKTTPVTPWSMFCESCGEVQTGRVTFRSTQKPR